MFNLYLCNISHFTVRNLSSTLQQKLETMEIIMQPWPWYVGGPIVGFIMLILMYLGKSFGFSSNFRTLCSALGAEKAVSFSDSIGKHNVGICYFWSEPLQVGM